MTIARFHRLSDRFEPPTRYLAPTSFPQLLRRRPSLLLSVAGARAARLIEETLAILDVDSRGYAVLAFLAAAAGPAPQQVIALRLRRDRTTVMELVDDLESKGLVGRRGDPSDGRVNAVDLTRRGVDWLQSAEANLEAAEMELLGLLSVEDERQLLRLLRRLA